MPKPVYLTLTSDGPFLTAIGHLFATPAPEQDPETVGFSIRNTIGAEFELPSGQYTLRFKVKNGQGAFRIVASGSRANGNDNESKEFDTGKDGFNGLTFEFTVS